MPFPDWFDSGHDESRFLRRVLDHVSDCLIAVDTQGRVVLVNGPYCQLLGGKEEDFIGRHITDVVSPDTRLHRVARGEGVVMGAPLEVKGHHLITRQVPVFQDGEIIGAVGLALFSNFELLKKAFTLASHRDLAIEKPKSAWIARHDAKAIIGRGPRMDAVQDAIRAAAPHSLPVLIHGETGTGKELAASAIHTLSNRAGKPFVWVNCASIPENLIDAELFGYEGGSFTGARTRGKLGKFEIASGGTLFLDEIGDMPMHLQASLLRAVQDRQIVRVGGVEPVAIDTRIICATNRPLHTLVAEGKFRSDLFYRLDVFDIALPPLRVREDLQFLIEQLLEKLKREHALPGRSLAATDMRRLLQHDWPGNVRELEAVLIRFLITGQIVLAGNTTTSTQTTPSLDLQDHLMQEKQRYIRQALDAENGDKEKAAQRLGISRSSLYRELQGMAI
jgi:transcriptional regulator with PAS, ATPase and Fis domain